MGSPNCFVTSFISIARQTRPRYPTFPTEHFDEFEQISDWLWKQISCLRSISPGKSVIFCEVGKRVGGWEQLSVGMLKSRQGTANSKFSNRRIEVVYLLI